MEDLMNTTKQLTHVLALCTLFFGASLLVAEPVTDQELTALKIEIETAVTKRDVSTLRKALAHARELKTQNPAYALKIDLMVETMSNKTKNTANKSLGIGGIAACASGNTGSFYLNSASNLFNRNSMPGIIGQTATRFFSLYLFAKNICKGTLDIATLLLDYYYRGHSLALLEDLSYLVIGSSLTAVYALAYNKQCALEHEFDTYEKMA